MKILLYGFKPFGDERENISENIIKAVRFRKGLVKKVLPVECDKGMFTLLAERAPADFILGLGQCGRGRKIRIERTAYGKDGRKSHVNMRLKPNVDSRLSFDAGRYVCNFSMLTMLGAIRQDKTKFAFLHVPKKFGLKRAVGYVEKCLDEMMRGKE